MPKRGAGGYKTNPNHVRYGNGFLTSGIRNIKNEIEMKVLAVDLSKSNVIIKFEYLKNTKKL